MKLRDLNIGTQLKLGYGMLIIMVVGMGVLSWIVAERMVWKTATLIDHPLEVQRAAGSLQSGVLSISHHTKDLFLNLTSKENATLFHEVERCRSEVDRELATLYALYLGPREDVDRVRDEFNRYIIELENTFALIREGEISRAMERSNSETGIMGHQVNVVLEAVQRVNNFARHKADELLGGVMDENRRLNAIIVNIVMGIIILSILIIYWLITAINRPIRELLTTMQAFKSGETSVRNQYQYRNELGKLSAGFNEMAETIALELQQRKKIGEISSVMLQEEDPHAFCRLLLVSLATQIEAQLGAIYLLNDKRDTYDPWECIGLDLSRCHSSAAGSLEKEFELAIGTRQIQHIKDIPEDTRFVYSAVSGDFIPRELITIPVTNRDTVIACITLGTITRFTAGTIPLLEKLLPTINDRMNGIFLYQKNLLFTAQLGEQNRELEEQKRKLSSLSDELKEQNRELLMQKNQLDEANRLKNNFLANMSHELRTPLNSVIALSGVLARRLSGIIPPEEFRYLGVIERNGRHLLSLINDLLDISRIEAGREEIDVTAFSLSGLLADIVETLKPIADSKGLALSHHQVGIIPEMQSDYRKCLHIIQNIVSNAVKFTQEGSVDIQAEMQFDMVRVSVKDTGIGIGNHELEAVFDEFHQSDSGNSRKFGGTGLGLSIARKYALLLGGRVEVESIPQQGSLFSIYLPLSVAQEIRLSPMGIRAHEPFPVSPVEPLTPTDHTHHTVLLVDDSEPVIIQLKDLFASQGYTVIVAAHGAEAIDLTMGLHPDIIILDLMMPKMDGFSVLQHIRENEEMRGIPVIILTAKFITREELAVLKANKIRQVILKGDIDKEHLLESVALALSSGKNAEESSKIARLPILVTDKPRVLVVEDDPDNMLAIKALLPSNVDVYEALTGREAVHGALEYLPHLILMDIALPEMNGIEALHAIRKDIRTGHIPVLAVSASAMLGDKDSIFAEGFEGYIVKPLDRDLFREEIGKFIK